MPASNTVLTDGPGSLDEQAATPMSFSNAANKIGHTQNRFLPARSVRLKTGYNVRLEQLRAHRRIQSEEEDVTCPRLACSQTPGHRGRLKSPPSLTYIALNYLVFPTRGERGVRRRSVGGEGRKESERKGARTSNVGRKLRRCRQEKGAQDG